ncbi:hypothetical protein ARAM_007591 [Aspergillus rambellii]|uniref:Myb-like domain-containing protein n=2 Tax=Aspergillus subgen. Nidulantes TaxID=2720870 RepID=A0A0F8UK67_9EURO|nr:hypothetical protein ARAM_007591 [Aspergillus rambellii]KKK23038.1 hypothetical protein AOCH_007620 [Aspergillus ochraceoroseus]
MDRQISYNGPLTLSPLPCNFPGSRSPTPMKYPLPLKPPISMYFHAYTFLSPQPKTSPRDVVAQHIEYGKSISVNNGQNRPFANHHATASSNGVCSSPRADSVISSSGEGSSKSTTYCCPRLILLPVILPRPGSVTGLENDCDETSSINSDDLLHPDELFSRIPTRSDTDSCEASVAHKTMDSGSETSSAISKPMIPLSDGSKSGLSNMLGLLDLMASCQLDEESQVNSSGCRGPQPMTETIVCSPSRIFWSKCHRRKEPACSVLGYAELATGRGPRTRARARAEASRSFPSRQRGRPYSDAEDALLRELVYRKLEWEHIEEEFGRRFTGRDLKSLQRRWSRHLKFEARPVTCSKPRGK